MSDLLNATGKAIRGSGILAVGLAYKPDVSDDRESASLEVARKLQSRGADVHVFDPYIAPHRIVSHGFEVETSPDSDEGYDLAVILTDHTGAPYPEIARSAERVIDTRGVYRRLGLRLDNVEAL